MIDKPTYRSWRAMLTRCTNPYSVSYAQYGGRGVAVCDRWLKFPTFLADMGIRPPGTSLDRIDNSRGYEPANCRWASRSEQNRNRGKFTRGKVRKAVVLPKSPRPRGRPPSSDPATERVEFRATPAEKDKYRRAARRAKVALSAWLKAIADRESS